jgi:hypothetical protein
VRFNVVDGYFIVSEYYVRYSIYERVTMANQLIKLVPVACIR